MALAALTHLQGAMAILLDAGDILDKSDLNTVGSNYLAMAGTLANKLSNALQNTMNNTLPIGVIMKLVFWIMGLTFIFHILQAIFKGIQDGHPKGLVGEILDTLWTHGPRIFVFVTLSLMVAGVSSITNVGTNVQAVHVNNNYVLAGTVDHGAYQFSPVQAMQQTLRNSWGKEFDTVPAPMAPLKAGTTAAIKSVSALNLIVISKRITNELWSAAAAGQKNAGISLDKSHGIDETLFGWILKDILTPLGTVAEEAAFIGAQYSMMKNVVASYIFMVLAWRMALHFLPLMVCLAYFRSMQGFLMNTMKQLVALSIAGAAMGALAQKLYAGEFWLGPGDADAQKLKGGGLIGDLFKGVMVPPSANNFTSGSYPWFMVEVYGYIAVIQMCALFGLVGVLLGEIYNIVRGALDGAMRSSYSAGISSTFGR